MGETLKPMNQSVITKTKKIDIKYWIVKTIMEHSIYVYESNISLV